MKKTYCGFNRRPFTSICDNFGRQIIYTSAEFIDESNIVAELNKALTIHEQNAIEIEYLDRYYRGDAPILYRNKKNRPEINNKVVINIAQYIVTVNASTFVGEPIQYVLKATDDSKSEELRLFNSYLDDVDKEYSDIDMCLWRSICGTGYRFVGTNPRKDLFSESPFSLKSDDPRKTFVAYYDDETPAFSCQIRVDSDLRTNYWVFTQSKWFRIVDNAIEESGINGNGAIPVIEYPNNARRLSDIEITISLTDEINKLASDRANAVEGFVSAWVKFINCDIDIDKFRQVRDEGFFSVTSNNGSENRSDVDIMTSELNQSETQVAVDDLFNKLLIIQGIANRETNTGGDTGQAVSLRNGWTAQEQKAKFNEPIFKRSEKQLLRILLNILRIKKKFTLLPTDIDVKITRSKNTDMLTKAEVLKILLDCGIDETVAIKTIDLFSDPEQVAYESKERMQMRFQQENGGSVNGTENEQN